MIAALEPATYAVAGAALLYLAVSALRLPGGTRVTTAVPLGVAALFSLLWGVGSLVPAAVARFGVALAAFRLLFFLSLGAAVFLFTVAVLRVQAQRLEASLEEEDRRRRELAEKDRLYRTVLSGSPVCLFSVDAGGVVRLAEGEALQRVGLDGRQMVGQPVMELLVAHPEAQDAVRRTLDGEPFTGTVPFGGRVFEVTLGPLRDPKGGVVQVIGLCVDVTERVRQEEAEREAMKQRMEVDRLQEMDAFKTRLLNTASHELNTPITPLILQLHVLRRAVDGGLVDKQQRALEVMDRNMRRLADLVKDILEVARMQTGSLKVQVGVVSIQDVVDDVVETYLPQAQEHGVRLHFDVEPGLSARADPVRLHQVLSNLITNALRFTPPEGTVTLRARRDGDTCMVEVEDTGAGMTQEQMGRLFHPFSQVHDPEEHNVGGSGLGLYICKGIVEEHAGRIGCESEGPGRGCLFWFTLPQAEYAGAAAVPGEAEAQADGS